MENKSKLKYVLIGAGIRGRAYTKAAIEEHGCQVVAVADPNEATRNFVRDTYGVSQEMCFESYEQLLSLGKIADFAMICTQDKLHVAPALMAIEQGYDLLLEKPAAPTPEECMQICKAAEEKGVRVLICHVLRYAQFFRTVKDIIDSGRIGKIMNIIHTEGVGNVHYSHSYVRGNWHNIKESSNMLLAKSCHDLDILQWLIGANCKKIQSFGGLHYFKKENCPEGAPKRCLDGCPHEKTCPYHVNKIYLPEEMFHFAEIARPAAAKKVDPTDEEVRQALNTTNYGVCVFQSDNDVVDHQTVNMEFDNGETVVFTMAAFNFGTRRIRIMGTKGELSSEDMNNITLNLFCEDDPESEYFGKPRTMQIATSKPGFDQTIVGGHGGGDRGIVDDLCLYFGEDIQTKSISSIRTSIMNHMLVFAAEESRATNTVVDVDEFMKKYNQ